MTEAEMNRRQKNRYITFSLIYNFSQLRLRLNGTVKKFNLEALVSAYWANKLGAGLGTNYKNSAGSGSVIFVSTTKAGPSDVKNRPKISSGKVPIVKVKTKIYKRINILTLLIPSWFRSLIFLF